MLELLGETLTLFRPIYYLLTAFLICNFVYLIFLRNKINANIYILLNSFFLVILGAVLLFQQGIIVDEFNRSGDSVDFFLMIASGLILLFTFLLYIQKNK